MRAQFVNFLSDEKGQDVIEWGLLAAFISVIAIVTIKAIGPLVTDMYEDVETAITP